MKKKLLTFIGIMMSSLIMSSAIVSTYAYWHRNSADLYIPTIDFNATEEEFTYFACVPSIISDTGYDYYDLEQIPDELVSRITGLATVRYESLTKTSYIPEYPEVFINGIRYNANDDEQLPVIHILNSYSTDDASVKNGFERVECLIIPESVTYIEPHSFDSATSLEEVSFLGSENSGKIYYSETNFNGIDLRFQHEARETEYKLSSISQYSHIQFPDGVLQYDYLNKVHSTFVIPNTDVSSISIDGASLDVDMKANTKYLIQYDNLANTIAVKEYKYYLEISDTTSIPLVLNTSVDYEEYILNENDYPFSVIEIPTIGNIWVKEYVDGNHTSSNIFNLANLDASYSHNNQTYEVKYAPSMVYESNHYYEDEQHEDKKITTQTQISVEKAYFLNKVTSTIEHIEGKSVKTISVPYDSSYLNLYVKTNNESDVDPVTGERYIKMNLENNQYTYSFTGTSNELPTSFAFYKGKYNAISFPTYVQSYDSENTLRDEMHYGAGEFYYYLDFTKANMQSKDNSYSGQTPTYQWYLVYWDNDGTLYDPVPLYYNMGDNNLIRFTIPSAAYQVKFARIPCGTDINEALENDWDGVIYQNDTNIAMSQMHNFGWNTFKFWSWLNAEEGIFSILNYEKNYHNNEFLRLTLSFANLSSTSFFNDDHVQAGQDHPNYQWYLVYWKNENGIEKQFTKPIYYRTNTSKYIDFEVPYDAAKFKFARIPYDEDINECLLNGWAGVVNQNGTDFKLSQFNNGANLIAFSSWYTDPENSDKFNTTLFRGYAQASYWNQDRTYLVFDNYMGDEESKYLKLDLNINYHGRLVDGSDIEYKFYKKENIDSIDSMNISLTKGTIISPKLYNVFTNLYETISFEESDITVNDSYTASQYFTVNMDGNIVVLRDCSVNLYFNANYSASHEFTGATMHFDILSTELSDLSRTVVADIDNPLSVTPTIENVSLDGDYSILTSTDVALMKRNYANLEYEEYYAYDSSNFNGSYIVSNLAELGTKYGFSYSNDYYGNYSYNDSQVGEYVISGVNTVNFTPNSNGADNINLEVIDDDNLKLSSTSYSYLNSMAYGRQYFVVNLPIVGYEYGVSLSDPNGNYVSNDIIQMTETDSSKLVYEAYINTVEDNYGLIKESNDSANTFYSFDNFKVEHENGVANYTLYLKNGSEITIANNSTPMDFSIIDGYTYTGLEITGNQIVFPGDGYYNLRLLQKDSLYYLGYKYRGTEINTTTSYFVEVYVDSNLVERYEMTRTINTNNYYYDIYIDQANTSIKVVDQNKVLKDSEIEIDSTGLYRIHAVEKANYDWNVNGSYVKVVNINFKSYLVNPHSDEALTYVMSLENSIYNKQETPITNHMTSASQNKYEVTSDDYGALPVAVDYYNGKYCGYYVSKALDQIININGKNHIIQYPGYYYIEYDGTKVVTRKVQESESFKLVLNNKEIATLYISNSSQEYVEYTLDDYIVFNEDIYLSGTTTDEISSFNVVDKNNIILSTIDMVTLVKLVDDGTSSSKTGVIPHGVYQLTYSIDSSRRENSNYYVFTYIKLVEKVSEEVTLVYTNENGEEISKVVYVESVYGSRLPTFEELGGYVPAGKEFSHWASASSGGAYRCEDGGIYSNEETLYATFKDKEHEVIFLSDLTFDSTCDIEFSLTNLEGFEITKVICDPKYTQVTSEMLNDFISIDSNTNIVSIKTSICELIGYNRDEDQIFIVTITDIDRNITYDVTIYIPYFELTDM